MAPNKSLKGLDRDVPSIINIKADRSSVGNSPNKDLLGSETYRSGGESDVQLDLDLTQKKQKVKVHKKS